jgi:hypothetical protein
MLPEIDLDIPEHNEKKERDIVVAIEHVRMPLVNKVVAWLLSNSECIEGCWVGCAIFT